MKPIALQLELRRTHRSAPDLIKMVDWASLFHAQLTERYDSTSKGQLTSKRFNKFNTSETESHVLSPLSRAEKMLHSICAARESLLCVF